ncbi:hypothetical protein C8F01DRAFT_1111736 [Mycena amicta]|nr:hypothetical protein C8F01DRAFT_1111736 [Mycena amicta]
MQSSPFQTILHTNTVPTDAQVEEIRAFLDPHRLELTELDKEVHRLVQLLREVTNQRDELQEMIAAHEALVSPMRRIPDDVLRLIFLHTLPDRRNAALNSDEGPLLLSRHLVVVPDAPDSKWGPGRLNVQQLLHSRMEVWLKRSAAVPLAISMHISRQYYIPTNSTDSLSPTGMPSPFLSSLLLAAKRWGSIQLHLLYSQDVAALSTLNAEDVPYLESFDISLTGNLRAPASAWEEREYGFNFLATGSLRSFSFKGTYNALPRTLAWRNLRILRMEFFAREMPAAIPFPFPFLQECTSLETLALTVSGDDLQFEVPASTRTVLPHLTTLSLANLYPPDLAWASSAVHALSLPALHTLDVSRAPVNAMTLLQPMVYIRCLAISLELLTSDETVTVFKTLPLLEQLRLGGEPSIPPAEPNELPPKDPDFLARFIPKDGTDTLCPALRHLQFTFAFAMSDELILRFLRSRTLPLLALHPTVEAISCFDAYICRKQDIDVRQELLDVHGLKIRLIYQAEPVPMGYSALEGTERDPDRSDLPLEFDNDWRQESGSSYFL